MKVNNLKTTMSIFLLGGMLTTFTSCGCSNGGSSSDADVEESDSTVVQADADVPTREYNAVEGAFHHIYLVADQKDEKHIYKQSVNKDNCFIVISKKEYRLYVYEASAQDTALVASFPVCYAIKPGPKTGEGDNCTPECTMDNPFHMSEINDASTWCFDFQDGRGPIIAFGHWFHRLDLSQSFPDNPALAANRSIGIHGSTGNEMSVPGRDSHGCVRMLDADLNILHDSYAHVGMPVIIKGINVSKYPFELAAQAKLGAEYVAPHRGNPLFGERPKGGVPDGAPEASAVPVSGGTSAAPTGAASAGATAAPSGAPAAGVADPDAAPRNADGVVGAGSGMTGTSTAP